MAWKGRMRKKLLLILVAVMLLQFTGSAKASDLYIENSGAFGNGAQEAGFPDYSDGRIMIVLRAGSPYAIVGERLVELDSDNPELVPYEKDGKIYLPVGIVCSWLGGSTLWNSDGHYATVVKNDGTKIVLHPKDGRVETGKGQNISLPMEIYQDRIFIGSEALASLLDASLFQIHDMIFLGSGDRIESAKGDIDLQNKLKNALSGPRRVGNIDKLAKILEEAMGINRDYSGGSGAGIVFDTAADVIKAPAADGNSIAAMRNESQQAPMPAPSAAASMNEVSSSPKYSETNEQVSGVAEGDIVKTDGEYLYQVNNSRIVVAKVFPAEEMKVTSTVAFQSQTFSPQEIYLYGKLLVVIGTDYRTIEKIPDPYPIKPYPATPDVAPAEDLPSLTPSMESSSDAPTLAVKSMPLGVEIIPIKWRVYPLSIQTTKAIVFDISDKSNISRIREMEVDGSYLSSRMIGSSLYLISNRYVNYTEILDGAENIVPKYRDSVNGGDWSPMDLKEIHYFPESLSPQYLIVAGVNLDAGGDQMKISSYLGSGQNVYCSTDNLYVAMTEYRRIVENNQRSEKPAPSSGGSAGFAPAILPAYYSEPYTKIYRFSLKEGQIGYSGTGEAPGTILNQFSMDEFNGFFRIATTSNRMLNGSVQLVNDLYVFDENLKIAGKIENIAPGEKIYSTRFMGNRGYMVTFKTTDPLFVLDLTDPWNPSILGALKIPGYSDYLHPYDENHIIGFGKDTVEVPVKDYYGNVIGTNAYYLGMKISLFDVTDVSNPIELFTENIGDRGTDSELLRNHKALLFDKDRGLLAFPVTVMEVNSNSGASSKAGGTDDSLQSLLAYGQFTFQGAYVYSLDIQNGFKLKGRITHIPDEEYKRAGNYWYSSDLNVRRIITIGDVIYTLSDRIIAANDIGDLRELNQISIP